MLRAKPSLIAKLPPRLVPTLLGCPLHVDSEHLCRAAVERVSLEVARSFSGGCRTPLTASKQSCFMSRRKGWLDD